MPARKAPGFRWQRYAADIFHVVIGGFLIRAGTAAVIGGALGWIGWIGSAWRQPLALQVVEILLICDLGFWLAHRLFHAVPWLWRFHMIHHSSEHLDWLAAYRVHPLDQIANSAIILLPALLLGFSPTAMLIYGLCYQWHAILLHSNVRISLGRAGRVIASPYFHHWHHANEEGAYNRNFGGQLVIWDCLFGTAHFPAASRPVRYGVDDPPTETFLSHIVAPVLPRKSNG